MLAFHKAIVNIKLKPELVIVACQCNQVFMLANVPNIYNATSSMNGEETTATLAKFDT